jgi:hypothetical protein
MLSHATLFNQNMSRWDVANVTSMTETFQHATLFYQDVAAWGDAWDLTVRSPDEDENGG